MGGSPTISTTAPRLGAIRYQQSAYGTVVPIVYGRTRISGNLMWYGDFKAIATTKTTRSGGKGGGGVKQKTTTYTYEAAIALAVAEGRIKGVPTVWKGKVLTQDLAELRLSLADGQEGQAVWGHLAMDHPDQALGYSGTAYLYSPNYELSDNAEVVNHTFEVSTHWEFSDYIFDALPPAFTVDALTHERYGARFPLERVGDFSTWANYCAANGLFLSPAMTEQREMREWLTDWARCTNSEFFWSEGLLKAAPYGDEAASGNGASFVPDLVAQYALTDDDFLADPGEDPVKVTRRTPADAYNQVQIEFTNRENQYNLEVVSASDQRNIEEFGLRPAPVLQLHQVNNQEVARRVAQLVLQRNLYIRNTYEFILGWRFARLEPMDLVTITDPGLGLIAAPVRIISIEESESGELSVQAEDFLAGVASTPAYPVEPAIGFTHAYNAAPGPVAAPVFIEPPAELTTTGLEVWVAVTGTTDLWGGCEIWASYSGSNYKRVGVVNAGARYGQLSAGLGAGASSGLAVALRGTGGQMISGDAEAAEKLDSLCYIRGTGPGDQPEFVAYETATLTGANAYTLAGLVRGAYGSHTGAQAAGAEFVRLDATVFHGEPLQPDMIGTTVRFKFVGFNVYGQGTEDISEVVEYSYTIRGDMARLPPPNVASFTLSVQGDGTRQFEWSWGAVPKPMDLRGYVVRFRQGDGPFEWDEMFPFAADDGFHTASPIETNQLLAGPYVFAIKTIDHFGVVSEQPLYIDAVLPDPRLGNSIDYVDERALGWPGVMHDCEVDTFGGDLVVRAVDQATWDDVPDEWDAFTRWVWDPVTSMAYETQPMDFGIAVPVLPVAIHQVDGQAVFEVSLSDDGVSWGAWTAVSSPVTTRFIRARLSVSLPDGSPTGPGITPVIAIRSFVMNYVGKVSSETGNDVDTAAFPWRVGAGDVRLPVAKEWVRMNRVSVTLQNVGAGWSWTLIDKDGVAGPRIRIYNGSGVLADALIDWTIEGIAT